MILDNKGEASLHPTSTPDTEVIQAVDSVAKGIEASSSKFFLPSDFISDELFGKMIIPLKAILEPVTVSYSNEILADQILVISIVLFIMCICILVLFVSLIFNVLILIYADRIQNYFTNVYII